MTYEEFHAKLHRADLSVRTFAELIGMRTKRPSGSHVMKIFLLYSSDSKSLINQASNQRGPTKGSSSESVFATGESTRENSDA